MHQELPGIALKFVRGLVEIRDHLAPRALVDVASGVRCLQPFIEMALLNHTISREIRDFLYEHTFLDVTLLEAALASSGKSNDGSAGSSGGRDTSGSNEKDAGG